MSDSMVLPKVGNCPPLVAQGLTFHPDKHHFPAVCGKYM
jgi:hypothetical protein